jgi:hypothetical protein
VAVYAAGKNALAICDVCGFPYKLRKLKTLYRNQVPTGLKACPECWEEDHPQNLLGKYRIEDAQAIRDPRPDHVELPAARGLYFQIPEATVIGSVKSVGVSVA